MQDISFNQCENEDEKMNKLKKRPDDVIESSVVTVSTSVVSADTVVRASASSVVDSVVGSTVDVRFNASPKTI